MTLVFRLDGSGIYPLPGGERDAGPGSICVRDCTETNVHHVARALKQYVKSSAHVSCTDVVQIVSWKSILAAMQEENTAAIATIRED